MGMYPEMGSSEETAVAIGLQQLIHEGINEVTDLVR